MSSFAYAWKPRTGSPRVRGPAPTQPSFRPRTTPPAKPLRPPANDRGLSQFKPGRYGRLLPWLQFLLLGYGAYKRFFGNGPQFHAYEQFTTGDWTVYCDYRAACGMIPDIGPWPVAGCDTICTVGTYTNTTWDYYNATGWNGTAPNRAGTFVYETPGAPVGYHYGTKVLGVYESPGNVSEPGWQKLLIPAHWPVHQPVPALPRWIDPLVEPGRPSESPNAPQVPVRHLPKRRQAPFPYREAPVRRYKPESPLEPLEVPVPAPRFAPWTPPGRPREAPKRREQPKRRQRPDPRTRPQWNPETVPIPETPPGTVPFEHAPPSVEFSPSRSPRPGPRHRLKPARRKEREKKPQYFIHARSKLGLALNAVTESCDIVEAIYYALPKKTRSNILRARDEQRRKEWRGGPGPRNPYVRNGPRTGDYGMGCHEQALALYDNIDDVDWALAWENVRYQIGSDALIGFFGGLAGKANRNFGYHFGIQVGPAL